MLTVTETAGAHLAELLAEVDAPDDTAIRFVFTEAALELTLDHAYPDDVRVEYDGQMVLLLDPDAASVLDGHTVDLEQSEDGSRLALS